MRKNEHVIKHGTVNEYSNYGCRCDECRAAWSAYHVAYMNRNQEQREKQRRAMREMYARYKRGEYMPPRGNWNDKAVG